MRIIAVLFAIAISGCSDDIAERVVVDGAGDASAAAGGDGGGSDITAEVVDATDCSLPEAGVCAAGCRTGSGLAIDSVRRCVTEDRALVCYPVTGLCDNANECGVRLSDSALYVSGCSGRLTPENGFRRCTEDEQTLMYAVTATCPK